MSLVTSRYDKLQRGSPAPDFTLKGVDGKTYSLADLKAKTLLIIFMCNHCPYVVPKIEAIKKIQADYKDLLVVGINSNNNPDYPDDSFEASQAFAKKNNFNFIYLFDETQDTARAYGAVCTPDPFLFDETHKLAYHGRIDDKHGKDEPPTKQELRDAIEEVLAGKEYTGEVLPSMGCSIKWV